MARARFTLPPAGVAVTAALLLSGRPPRSARDPRASPVIVRSIAAWRARKCPTQSALLLFRPRRSTSRCAVGFVMNTSVDPEAFETSGPPVRRWRWRATIRASARRGPLRALRDGPSSGAGASDSPAARRVVQRAHPSSRCLGRAARRSRNEVRRRRISRVGPRSPSPPGAHMPPMPRDARCSKMTSAGPEIRRSRHPSSAAIDGGRPSAPDIGPSIDSRCPIVRSEAGLCRLASLATKILDRHRGAARRTPAKPTNPACRQV